MSDLKVSAMYVALCTNLAPRELGNETARRHHLARACRLQVGVLLARAFPQGQGVAFERIGYPE